MTEAEELQHALGVTNKRMSELTGIHEKGWSVLRKGRRPLTNIHRASFAVLWMLHQEGLISLLDNIGGER
jgi:hypothetical protein